MINVVPWKIRTIFLKLYLQSPDAFGYLLLFMAVECIYRVFVSIGFYSDILNGIFAVIGVAIFVAVLAVRGFAAYIKKRTCDKM